jgi:hypothetical protein
MHVHLHLRLIAAVALFVYAVSAIAYQVWKRSSPAVRMILAVLLIGSYSGYRILKHLPPYEQGLHTTVVEAGVDPTRTDGPRIGNCPLFPADNVWNTPIDSLKKDPHTGDYIDSIGPLHPLHADFASNLDLGIPYSFLPPGTRSVKVTFDYRDDSDLGNYPIPPDAPIEGGPNGSPDGDRHIILVDQRKCVLYELFAAKKLPDGNYTAGSGIKMDLTSNALRADGKTSADAAGLPILPGLVRYDEVMSGAIHHALRFTVPHTRNTYIWPARHQASSNGNPRWPPMGTRFRLRADFDISKFSKTNQVILTALKHYGMFLADNGSPMFLSGVSDKRWDDSDLHRLGDVKAEDFEAVDESDWQFLADSARVDPLAVKH